MRAIKWLNPTDELRAMLCLQPNVLVRAIQKMQPITLVRQLSTDEFILKSFIDEASDAEMLEFIRELLTEQSGCPDSFKL